MITDDKRGQLPGASDCAPCSPGERGERLTQLQLSKNSSRRGFLKLAAGASAVAASGGCDIESWDEFVQDHYLRLSDEDKKVIFARLEEQIARKTGVDVEVVDPHPLEGVEFAYALDLSACNGNRRCVEACARENNHPNDPEIRYIRVLEMKSGSFDLEHSNSQYTGEVPKQGHYYLPVQCHQCRIPACTKACPTGATWKEPDGIVVVDYNWCIGCRYCQAACPYHARRFNFAPPTVEPDRINPHMGFLSNRLRMIGVVEKCTYCLQRTREGRYPACMEVCPTGARKFGNLADPNSEIRHIIEEKRVYILKEELGTLPRFYYFFT